MDATEKQILRAELLASGVIRYWQFIKAKDQLDRWLEVLGEALAEIDGSEAELKIRANLLTHGLRVPEVSTPVHVKSPIALQSADAIGDSSDSEVCSRLPKADSAGSAVHPPAATSIQAPQKSNTRDSGVLVEPKEVMDLPAKEHEERGFDLGLTNQACSTFRNMDSGSKPTTAVHPPDVTNIEAVQNSDNRRESVVVESKEVKGLSAHAAYEQGFNFGTTKQACRTCKRMHSESKPPTSPRLYQGAGSKVQQNAGHETDQSLNARFTLVDSPVGSEPRRLLPHLGGTGVITGSGSIGER